MRKGLFMCCMCLISISAFAQYHVLDGNWKPQTNASSCWAATLSNISRTGGSLDTIPESFYFTGNDAKEIGSLTRFGEIARKRYLFRRTGVDSVLNWLALGVTLSQPSARPLVYSFYYNAIGYHLVNFTGYEELSFLPGNFNRWIYVYDPLPQNKGKRYLKNYYSYQFIESGALGKDLQGTVYQFTDTTAVLPTLINNEQKAGTVYDSVSEGVSYAQILSGINAIVTSNRTSVEFNAVIGRYNESLSVQNSPMNIGLLRANPSGATLDILISSDNNSQLIPCVANGTAASGQLYTGAIIRRNKGLYMIDHLINLDFLNNETVRTAFSAMIRDTSGVRENSMQLITDIDGNRFIKFSDDRYMDLDNLFDKDSSQVPQVYKLDDLVAEFRKKLKMETLPTSSTGFKTDKIIIPKDWYERNWGEIWKISKDQFDEYKLKKVTEVIRSVRR